MAPVVQTLNSTIHGINHYTTDKYYQYAFWLDIDFIPWIKLSTLSTTGACRFYDINFCKSLPNGLELLQLSSSSWFLFQLGSWKARINCVKPTLKKQHTVLHLLISISVMLYDHYSIINVWLVFWFLKWEFFLNVSSKHAFFFQPLKSKFCYFVMTFIYQPCVLQLNFKRFIFSLKNIVKFLKLELTSRNRKLNERAHQRIIRLLIITKRPTCYLEFCDLLL